ncbi:hypothetical protein ACFWWU_36405 [Streptomyces sp. NPDC058650]|uniref:hypothetical protein n=1 Tax=Streptomyces sp. NPDC058650 TaxID=3346575 RepID=UPI003668DFB2
MSVEVRFSLPDAVWWQLTARAEDAGVDAREYVARIIREEVVSPRPEQITESVLRLHHAGLTIPLIARRLDLTNQAVQTRLYTAGLRGNKPSDATKAILAQLNEPTKEHAA